MKIRAPYDPRGAREIDWATTPDRGAPAREWSPNTLPATYAACGCYLIPWPLVRELGVDSTFCELHGWVKLPKNKRKAPDVGRYTRTPSEFGYQVSLSDGITE
jgi:hypothetical protein